MKNIKRQFSKDGVINSVALLKAVLCGDCECISESRGDVCPVCGGRSLVNLGRLLRSAMHAELSANVDVRAPAISRQLDIRQWKTAASMRCGQAKKGTAPAVPQNLNHQT